MIYDLILLNQISVSLNVLKTMVAVVIYALVPTLKEAMNVPVEVAIDLIVMGIIVQVYGSLSFE